MYLVNTTFGVDGPLAADFAEYIHTRFIPAATSGSGLYAPLLSRVMEQHPEEGAPESHTMALQMRARDAKALERYCAETSPALLQAIRERWGDRVVSFTTVLEVISRP